ncbi:MAG: hypothetical protein ABJH85_00870 [Paracoccaceae bacterium]
MTLKKSGGTVRDKGDFTIPSSGRKRKRAFSSQPPSENLQSKVNRPVGIGSREIPERTDSNPSIGPENATKMGSNPRHRVFLKWGAGAAVVATLGLIIIAIVDRETPFEAFSKRVCVELKLLPSFDGQSDNTTFALFSAACGATPKGR